MACSKEIPDNRLMEMSGKVSPADMRRIGVQYLNIKMPQIDIFREKWREDVVAVNFSILEAWRNANPGPYSHEKLYQLLVSASEDGLIQKDVFAFLMEGNVKYYCPYG